MPFDWEGVEVDDELYCCEPCSRGEPCVCVAHAHATVDAQQQLPEEVAKPGPL
jgi:hypothetical protein